MLRFRRSAVFVAGVIAAMAFAIPGPAMPAAGKAAAAAFRQPAPAALHGSLVGAMAPATELDLMVVLQGRHGDQIDRLIQEQSTPGSPTYGRYLTPEQYGQYFGATDRDYAAAIAALRAQDFTIEELYANRTSIEVRAPASVAESFFKTPIDLRAERGRVFFTNRYAPQLPPGLRIAAVVGLDDYAQLRSHAVRGTVVRANSSLVGWGADAIQSAYNLTPIYSKYTGKGRDVIDATIGLVRQSDFKAFEKKYGLKGTLSQLSQPKSPYDSGGESTLDVEWMTAIAPSAHVILVTPRANSSAGFAWMYTYIVNKLSKHHIVSTSWGECEQLSSPYGTDSIYADEPLFKQAELEGQWWMSAAGDWGTDDCEKTANPFPSVDYPGSSRYVMSVGGTSLAPSNIGQGKYRGWGSEVVWNDGGYNSNCGAGAGGGGNSVYFTRPPFQNGLSSAYMRQVPDVVLMADGCDLGGYVIYFKGSFQNNWGGTSFAAPEWAGFLALIESRYGSTPIPSPLYRLYALAATKASGNLFHNIVRGCNDYLGTPGFCAQPGYSPVGGLGSPIGPALQAAY